MAHRDCTSGVLVLPKEYWRLVIALVLMVLVSAAINVFLTCECLWWAKKTSDEQKSHLNNIDKYEKLLDGIHQAHGRK